MSSSKKTFSAKRSKPKLSADKKLKKFTIFHKPNSYLLFKQGLKSIFRYKLQLMIIVILSFLATVLLTASMSTTKRLQDGYNNYVNVPRFNYSYRYRVGSTVSNEGLVYFAPFMDFSPTFSVINAQGKNDSLFNIVYGSQYQSLAPEDKLFENVFDNSQAWSAQEIAKINFKSLVSFTYNASTSSISYNPNFNFLSESQNLLHDFFFKNVNTYLSENQNNPAQLKNSLIGRYYYYLEENNMLSPKTSTPLDSMINQDVGHNLIVDYVNFIFSKVESWMDSQVNNYFLHYFQAAIQWYYNHDDRLTNPNAAQLAIKFNSILNSNKAFLAKYGTAGLNFNLDPDANTTLNIANFVHSYLFGQKISGTTYTLPATKKFWGASQVGRYSLSYDGHNVNYNDYLLGSAYDYGLRGVVNPIQLTASQGTKFYPKFVSNLATLTQHTPFNYQVFNQRQTTEWETAFLLHQQMAAVASGFKINFRNEVFIFNNALKFYYRIVILQNDNNFFNVDLHMIKGVRPEAQNEIAVSPQFARANHISIGAFFPVNLKVYNVSGYATDAYSFLPNATDSSLLPNVEKSVIIYAHSGILKSFDDTSGQLQSYTDAFLTYTGQDPLSKVSNMQYDENLYQSLLMTGYKNSDKNFAYYSSNYAPHKGFGGGTALDIDQFNASGYRFNWTLLPLSYQIFAIVCYVSAALLACISLSACYIAVSRNIYAHAHQVAIFKSLGVPNWKISLSYLSYAFIVAVFAVPLGWVFGIVMQWPASELFQTFFSLNYNMILVDWRPLLIAFATVALFVTCVSFFTAYYIIQKPTTKILKPDSSWKTNKLVNKIKNRFFSNASFKTKFQINIVSTSVRKIGLISIIMFITSILITSTLALPVLINNISNSYFKSDKYKNQFSFANPTYNAPLSKVQLSQWSGPDTATKDYQKGYGYNANGGSDQLPNQGFLNPTEYFTSLSHASALPLISYHVNNTTKAAKPVWSYNQVAKDLSGQTKGMLSYFERGFGNNLYGGTGVGFSVFDIEGFLNWLYHADVTYNDANHTERKASMNSANSTIKTGISDLLSFVLDVKTPDPKLDWQDKIISEISSKLPPYVASYYNSSEARKKAFGFGWNYELLQPKQAYVDTAVPAYNKNGAFDLVGLDPQRQIIAANNSSNYNQLFVNDATAEAVQQVITDFNNQDTAAIAKLQDIKANGMIIYDAAKKTLNIPTYLNKQAASQFEYSSPGIINNNFRAQLNELQYKTTASDKTWATLPKQFFVYDDTDYHQTASQGVQMVTNQTANLGSQTIDGLKHYYLNPYLLENNNFTFNNQYSLALNSSGDIDYGQTKLNDTAFAAVVPTVQKDQVTPAIRPRYQYNDLLLYLPQDSLKVDDFRDPLKENSPNQNFVFQSDIPASDVPASVKVGRFSKVQQWVKIRPYSLAYDNRYNLAAPPNNLGMITNKYICWWRAVAKNPNNVLIRFSNVNTSPKDLVSDPGLTININALGSFDNYDTAAVYQDQKLVNALSHYTIGRAYNYNLNNVLTQPLYQKTNPDYSQSQYYIPAFNTQKVLAANHFASYAPSLWNNNKYSFTTEPYDLTTYYSTSEKPKSGIYLITTNHDLVYNQGPIVHNYNLLSAKQGLVDRITKICLSVTFVLIALIITCSALLIMLISNLFVKQYERFMILMKTQGYTNWQVIRYTINVFTPFVLVAWGTGAFLAWLIFYGVHRYAFYTLHFALPFSITWWVFLVSFVIVALMYLSIFIFTAKKLKTTPAKLLHEN